MKIKKVTVRDIAAKAGCSIASVSRFINGKSSIGELMQNRILQAADALGYQIKPIRRDQRPIIGVLVPSIANPVFASSLSGIEKCARQNNISVIIAQSNYTLAQEEEAFTALMREKPMGLIMTLCDALNSEGLKKALEDHIPSVTLYNEKIPEGVGTIIVDNRQAVFQATNQLINMGHRSIAFIGGKFSSSDRSLERFIGYEKAIKQAKLPIIPAFEVDFMDASKDIDLTVLIDKYHPTAIIASNDLLAITVITSLRRMRLSVPDDISVVGFDGIDFAQHISPKLTTIAQPSKRMGMLACSMICDIVANRRQAETVSVQTNFFPGETIQFPKDKFVSSF